MTNTLDTEIWIEDYLSELIELTNLDVYIEEISLDGEDVLHVQLAGPDSARIIGREGQALESLQHLVVSSAIHAGARRPRILLDVENYRDRRETRVREDAARAAEAALETGRTQELLPMSPRERRLVHMVVSEMDGVKTESRGQGEDRYVQIIPTR